MFLKLLQRDRHIAHLDGSHLAHVQQIPEGDGTVHRVDQLLTGGAGAGAGSAAQRGGQLVRGDGSAVLNTSVVLRSSSMGSVKLYP